MRLKGKTLVATHPADPDNGLIDALRQAGAKVLHCPCIRIVPPEDLGQLEEKVASLADYEWVLFTSKKRRRRRRRRFEEKGLGRRKVWRLQSRRCRSGDR